MGVTIPDIGVDLSGYATAIGTDLGAILAGVIGVAAAFLLVRLGWRFMRRVAS